MKINILLYIVIVTSIWIDNTFIKIVGFAFTFYYLLENIIKAYDDWKFRNNIKKQIRKSENKKKDGNV